MLERELCTLDVPYGETFSVQERWVACSADGGGSSELAVHAHVHFRSRGMLSTKIKTHALKKSRKCAALAAELLELAHTSPAEPEGGAGGIGGGGGSEEATRWREMYESLLEEATYYKNHAAALERENRRLTDQQKYARKGKKALAAHIVQLEAEIQKERRERLAMEEGLTEAYTATLREIVAQQDASAVATKGHASNTPPTSRGAGLKGKLNFR